MASLLPRYSLFYSGSTTLAEVDAYCAGKKVVILSGQEFEPKFSKK